jgi:DNA-binding NtrC family response regulator
MSEDDFFGAMESGSYDASDRPFDFVSVDSETALICETDPAAREKMKTPLAEMGYQITEPPNAKDAIRNMRFHVYDLIILNEGFNVEEGGKSGAAAILHYLVNLEMSIRRQIFLVLVSDKYRTMDNMAAFHKSVNLVVNPKNLDDFATIIKRGLDDNAAFYHVYRETLKKVGRL